MANKNRIKETCELWNQNNTVLRISKLLNIDRSTVLNHLNKGNSLRWCDYTREEDAKRRGQKATKNKCQAVIRISKEGEFIAKYNSITEASSATSVSMSMISSYCSGKIKSCKGTFWRYADR